MPYTPIEKILIANRGEIAARIIRTCRCMGIDTVAVCSDPDREAEFVRLADEVVPLGGARPSESYLRGELLIDAARRTGADAIHPGYGFLSENADFARACRDAGLIFIGPTPEAIAAMGSKLQAKRMMSDAEVPILPSVEVGDDAAAAVADRCRALDWPLLIKASAGGGGRGMRIVRDPQALAAQIDTARQEAAAAFGDGALFIEPYIETSRHVEVQIFGDQHGNVIHLFERECSIQRRHQKIIEESPSPFVDAALREALCTAAVRAGEQIGYVGAGTVEFLVTPAGQFYFLEVNTRLQVEHPVTELVTGLDLVRLQILVAAGEPLPASAIAAQQTGHAIEARLYAEDPAQDYLPAAGRLHRFDLPSGEGVRVDSGIRSPCEVSPYYDPMLAKVIVHAPSRFEATQRLAAVLRRSQIHGLTTNRELLVRILSHQEFQRGQTDTHFLLRHDVAALSQPLGDHRVQQLHAAAAALAAQDERRAHANVLKTLPAGYRNNASQLERVTLAGPFGETQIEYRLQRNQLTLKIDGEPQRAELVTAAADHVCLEVAGVQRQYAVHRCGADCFVDSSLGFTPLRELPRFPESEAAAQAGSLVAPLPGVVSEVVVDVGAAVQQGDSLVVIESMKVLHHITAPTDGIVSQLPVSVGDTIAAGAVLAVIEKAAE